MMAKFGMTLCALGIAEEMRQYGIASNTLWPRTMVATAAVQNLLGGDEAMARSRKPDVYADAAYAVLNKPATEYTGNTLLCEDVLLESGVTDLSVYDCVPGIRSRRGLVGRLRQSAGLHRAVTFWAAGRYDALGDRIAGIADEVVKPRRPGAQPCATRPWSISRAAPATPPWRRRPPARWSPVPTSPPN